MAYRQTSYQYETSPRKLKPEYEVQKNPYSKKKTSTLKPKQSPKIEQNDQTNQTKKQPWPHSHYKKFFNTGAKHWH